MDRRQMGNGKDVPKVNPSFKRLLLRSHTSFTAPPITDAALAMTE